MKKYNGRLDFVDNKVVRGWAMDVNSDNAVEVSLYVNEKFVASQLATNFRKDLFTKKIHPSGNCGFEIQVPSEVMAHDKRNQVQVLVDATNIELRNSPKIFCYDNFLENTKEKVTKQLEKDIYKLLLVGLPKSGTSILVYTLAELFEDKILHFEPKGNRGLSDIDFHQTVVNPEKNIITKSLYFSKLKPKIDIVSHFYNKKVWIYRDPRDWMISEFFYCWYKAHNPDKKLFYKVLKMVEQKEKNPSQVPFYKILYLRPEFKEGRYNKWIEKLVEQFENLPEGWFLLRYEDFIDEKYDELNAYLGKELKTQSKVPNHLNRVVRTKKYGNWRRWFTEEDVQFFKPIYQEFLDKLGYDGEDWNLTPCDTLPSEEGSKYMRKIFGI